jgi:FkbM family methyltransferase
MLHRTLPPFALAWLRRGAAWRRQRSSAGPTVRRSYSGFELEIEVGDENAIAWYDVAWHEPIEVIYLRERSLRPGSRVFDLGAHQGVIALVMARIVGADGHVVALEAGPYDAQVADRNRARNAADNVVVLNAAVAATSGTLSFGFDGRVGSPKSGWPTSTVPAHSIDDLASKYGPPDVLFIDVEGYETEALKGATKTLAAGPDVFVEVHGEEALARFDSTPAEVLSYFPPESFEVVAADPVGSEFSLLDRDAIPSERFFLIALSRAARGT